MYELILTIVSESSKLSTESCAFRGLSRFRNALTSGLQQNKKINLLRN